MNLEKSLQLHSTQLTPLKNKRSKHILLSEETLNLSTILNESTRFNDTSLRHALDESSIINNTGNAGEGLNEAFFKIIQTSHPSDVLNTLAKLAKVCCDSLELIDPWNRYSAHNYWLAEEANTWKLLHCLYADSISEHPQSLENLVLEPTLSQKTLVDALFRSDPELRLLQLLVDWLEAIAAYQDEATRSTAPVIANNVQWGNTLHQLLIGSSLFNKDKSKNMVTCMDPDAPFRQKKSIHCDDLQEDNDLCKRIFTQVRCGQFTGAISMCINGGQAWRGAVLQGWRLLHYLPREDSKEHLEINGNPSRDLWKWCALGIANNVYENIHYRATIGVLCGHLASTIPACQGNWEDLLWAHLRIQIEARVDKFLHEHYATVSANTTSSDVLELLQTELMVEELSLPQIFSAVNALMDGKKESNYQICQRHLMLGHIKTIMQDSLQWIDGAEPKYVRFLAHLILVLRQMGKDPLHDIGDTILEKYVIMLIDKIKDGSIECPALIAYYISTLPFDRQIVLYADFMDHVDKSDYREGVITAGLNAKVDVAASACVTIKQGILNIHRSYGNLDFSFTQTAKIEKDKTLISKVISSLEWLALVPKQLEEALWLCNAMIRTFIFIGDTDAASVCTVRVNQMFPSYTKKISSDSSELREHLCLKTYLEALDSFATWYRHYINGQPKDVEPLASNASFSDKVYHEQRCAQVEQQKLKWKNAIVHQARHTKNLLYNVLLFPGGWLQDENESTSSLNFSKEDKADRLKQLDTLRRLCIPEIVLLIIKILQSDDSIEHYKEALKLSDIIAAENRCLYKVFTKSKLLEILDKIRECSLFLLEKNRDMFGFEIDDE